MNNRRVNAAFGVILAAVSAAGAFSAGHTMLERHFRKTQAAGYALAVEDINRRGCRKIEEVSGTNMLPNSKPKALFDSRRIIKVPTILVKVSDKPCEGGAEEIDQIKVKNLRDRANYFAREQDTETPAAATFEFFAALAAFFSFKSFRDSRKNE
ncbi:hypothetical protein HY988_06105 [Candidatus Micrarchaeota archaeon]|nr:hypothetical protein [Candidatus Micrarchaeota archaeon]